MWRGGIFLFLTLLSSSALAEITGAIGIVGGFDSNLMQDSTETSASQAQTTLSLIHANQSGTFFYNGQLTTYPDLTERSNQSHQVGYLYEHFLPNNNGLFDLSGSAEVHINQTQYKIYDFHQIEFEISAKYYLRDDILFRASYALERMAYPNFSIANLVEHRLFLQSNVFFPTKTTLRIESELGRADHVLSLSDSTAVRGGPGWRWQNSLRLAQAIFTETGLSLEWTNFYTRLNDTQNAAYVDIFLDSRYAYRGHDLQLMITQRFKTEMTARLFLETGRLKYLSPVFGDTEKRRYDDRFAATIFLSKSCRKIPLTLSLKWAMIKNQSNDAQFDYDSLRGTFGVNWDF